MDAEQEMDEYSERGRSPRHKRARRIFRIALTVLVVAVNALILWRLLFSDRVPAGMKTLTPNTSLCAAYAAAEDLPDAFTQPQVDIIWDGETRGYFWVVQAVFIPEAQQIQVLIRYNNSTLRHIAEDFTLDAVPGRDEDVIDVTLVRTEKGADDTAAVGTRYFSDGTVRSGKKNMYNYRRYTFEGVTAEDAAEIRVEFYYKGAVNYDGTAYGTLRIYDDTTPTEHYALTGRDRAALAAKN